jgi:membrane protein
MARMRDIPRAIRKAGFFGFGKRVVGQVLEDDCFTLAASMAYSWLFAIFPFFIFLLGLIPYIPLVHTDRADEMIGQFLSMLPEKEGARATIEQTIIDLKERPRKGLLGVGIIMALWVASGGMATTMSAISKCYDVSARPIYIQRPLAMGLTVLVVALIVAVIILLPVASVLRAWLVANPEWLEWLGGNEWMLVAVDMLRYLAALILLFGALSIIYYFGPPIKQTYHFVTPGAVFVVVSWMALGLGFKWYVSNFANYNATYGAVGGVIVLLFIFYMDSLMLLIGAEINSEIDILTRTPTAKPDDFSEKPEKELVEERQEIIQEKQAAETE